VCNGQEKQGQWGGIMSTAIKVSDFVASDSPFLCKEQIQPYGVIRAVVERVTVEQVPLPGSSKREPKFVLWLKGWKKGVVVGARRNRKFLAKLFGGVDCSGWPGKPVWLYYDPSAKFGAQTVGGIRFAWGSEYSGDVAPPKPTPADAAVSSPGIDPSEEAPAEREPGEEG
jgi:hypothetical protein